MTHLPQMWTVIRPFLDGNRWIHLRDIYNHVQDSLPLDLEDFEPQAPGSKVPRWKRNVRAVLQHQKKSTVEWDRSNSRYRLRTPRLIATVTTGQYFEANLPEEVADPGPFVEGAVRQVIVNAYERDTEARRQCIAKYGAVCKVCGFDFGKVYGPEAESYIHVHHIRPLSKMKRQYDVDPIRDLIPVCPNCHAVIHMSGRCRTLKEVKQLLVKHLQKSPT